MSVRTILDTSTGKISTSYLPRVVDNGVVPSTTQLSPVPAGQVLSIDNTFKSIMSAPNFIVNFQPAWLSQYGDLQVNITVNIQHLHIKKPDAPNPDIDITDVSLPLYLLLDSTVAVPQDPPFLMQLYKYSTQPNPLPLMVLSQDTASGLYSGSVNYIDYIPTSSLTGSSFSLDMYAYFPSPDATTDSYASLTGGSAPLITLFASVLPVNPKA